MDRGGKGGAVRGAIPGTAVARSHPHFSGTTMLGVSGLVLLLSAPAQTYGFSVFIDPMLAEFGWSRTLISGAFTIATLVSAGAVMLAGGLIDRFGHRRLMAIMAVVYAVSLVAMGAVANPATLLVGLILMRISGSSVLTLTARTLIAQWYVRRRGRAVSLINLGKVLGMALVPPANAVLIERFGWRAAWQVNAVLVASLVPLALLVVRGRPEEVGQFPDGRRPDGSAAGAAADLAADEASWTLRQALRTRALWLLVVCTVVPATVTNGLSFVQISVLAEAGLSARLAATTFAVESVVALPMTLLVGWLADRLGPRPVLVLGQVALAVAMVWLAFTTTPAAAFAFGALRGLAGGTWILASEVAWPAYFGRRHLGSIVGFSFAVGFIGAAIGPLPFGLVSDAFGSYRYAIWGMTTLPVLATVAALLARPPGLPPATAATG